MLPLSCSPARVKQQFSRFSPSQRIIEAVQYRCGYCFDSRRELEDRQWGQHTPSSPSFLLLRGEERTRRFSLSVLPSGSRSVTTLSQSVSQSVSESVSRHKETGCRPMPSMEIQLPQPEEHYASQPSPPPLRGARLLFSYSPARNDV